MFHNRIAALSFLALVGCSQQEYEHWKSCPIAHIAFIKETGEAYANAQVCVDSAALAMGKSSESSKDVAASAVVSCKLQIDQLLVDEPNLVTKELLMNRMSADLADHAAYYVTRARSLDCYSDPSYETRSKMGVP